MKVLFLVAMLCAAGVSFAQWNPNGATTGPIYYTGGSVGIGTSTPQGKLHLTEGASWSSHNYGASLIIEGTRNNAIGIFDATNSNPIALVNSGGSFMVSHMPALGNTGTAPQQRFVISSSGNVGVGTTSPNARLHVVGSGASASPTTSVGVLSSVSGATDPFGAIQMTNDPNYGANYFGARARDNSGSLGAVLQDDVLTGFYGRGHTGTAWSNGMAAIRFVAAQDFATGLGTQIEFATTSLGGTSRSTRMLINPSGNVGIGTTSPVAKLHVVENSRDYQVNRIITTTNGGTEDGAGTNYLLLHKMYESTNLADHFIMGKITAIRGATGAWNRKLTLEVNTSSAYQTDRGSLISYNEECRLVTVTYQAIKYLAVEIGSNSKIYNFSFTGYAQNEELRVVFDQDISNPQPFTQSDPVSIPGKFKAGGVLFESLSSLPAEGAISEGTWGTYFVGDNSTARGVRFGVVNDFYTKAEIHFDNSNRIDGTINFKTSGTNTASVSRMFIKGDGNVGIGTVNPTQKLEVNGTVYSREVKVDLAAGTGPDYVFEPTYNLPTLAETEAYIKANKHLPEVPSAKEMEANGINLSEMNMLLLKKVEELTLHLIEMKKENIEQQQKIDALTSKVETLTRKQ